MAKVPEASSFCKFLAFLKPGNRVYVESGGSAVFWDDQGRDFRFKSPFPDPDGCEHPGIVNTWIQETLNPIWRAGSQMLLVLTGITDTVTDELRELDPETPEEALEKFGGAGRSDNFKILVYRVVDGGTITE